MSHQAEWVIKQAFGNLIDKLHESNVMMTKMFYTTFKQFKVGPESKHAYQSDRMTHLFKIVNRQITMIKIPLAKSRVIWVCIKFTLIKKGSLTQAMFGSENITVALILFFALCAQWT